MREYPQDFKLEVEFQPKSDERGADSYFCILTYKGKPWEFRVKTREDLKHMEKKFTLESIMRNAIRIITNVMEIEYYESGEAAKLD